MVSRTVAIITGLIALGMVGIFTIGLAHSISIGFAGFWGLGGGIVFGGIVGVVLLMALYDFYDTAVRKRRS